MERVYDKKENCCGCALCADVCPKDAIKIEKMHNMYPVIDAERCVDCSLCRKVCQFSKRDETVSGEPLCFAARIKDDEIRLKSSSGGAFTVLSDSVLKRGGAVCGAVFEPDMSVCHVVANTKEERDRMRGAKYVQSDLSLVYAQMQSVLEEGKALLFSGTPCQVAAVKKRFSQFADKLYTVDLICHGVPSNDLWKNYIAYLESVYKKRVVNFTFRDKSVSWRTYHAVVTFEDGSVVSDTLVVDSFVELFRYDVTLRESCTACPYASTVREGDVTIGDFWGIQDHFPEMDDNRGVSALMLNTSKGRELLPELEERMWLTPCKVEQIAEGQPNMFRSSKPSNKKEQFMKDYEHLPFQKLLKKYTRLGLKRRVVDFVKKILGK